MTHEKLTSEVVEKIRAAAGDNLLSVVLYGSAADGEFHPEYSDLNLLCLVREASFPALNKIAGVHQPIRTCSFLPRDLGKSCPIRPWRNVTRFRRPNRNVITQDESQSIVVSTIGR